MGLCKPKPTGAPSSAADSLQHEAAMRVQARIDAEDAKKRLLERKKKLVSLCATGALVAVVGAAVYLYACGYFDPWLPPAAETQNKVVVAADEARQQIERVAVKAESKIDEAKIAAEKAAVERKRLDAERAQRAYEQARAQERALERERAAREKTARFNALLSPFSGAKVDYWKNAPRAERPESADEPRDYVALVPEGDGFASVEMHKAPGVAMTIREKSTNGIPFIVSSGSFRRRIAGKPYFVLSGGTAYLCTPKGKDKKRAVPKKDEPFDPARAAFGALADVVAAQKMDAAKIRYAVSFRFGEMASRRLEREERSVKSDAPPLGEAASRRFKEIVPVCEVGFGETVGRDVFAASVKKRLEDGKRAAAEADVAAALDAGEIVFAPVAP